MSARPAANANRTAQRSGTKLERLWSDVETDAADRDALQIDVDGFEGPLDLLLHLAREQRVDMLRISVVALVEQYLQFIEKARALRLELAADYLVMAAWLAYLKSKLLLPKPEQDADQSADEMASVLQFRLRRLEAMRDCSKRLFAGNTLRRDVWPRGAPEALIVERRVSHSASLYDLLMAYGSIRQRASDTEMSVRRRKVWSLKEARTILEAMLGRFDGDWRELTAFLVEFGVGEQDRVSAIASSFAASLELVREGGLQLRQDSYLGPIYMRRAARPQSPGVDHDA